MGWVTMKGPNNIEHVGECTHASPHVTWHLKPADSPQDHESKIHTARRRSSTLVHTQTWRCFIRSEPNCLRSRTVCATSRHAYVHARNLQHTYIKMQALLFKMQTLQHRAFSVGPTSKNDHSTINLSPDGRGARDTLDEVY